MLESTQKIRIQCRFEWQVGDEVRALAKKERMRHLYTTYTARSSITKQATFCRGEKKSNDKESETVMHKEKRRKIKGM